MYTTPTTRHHQHNIINTTPSRQHHFEWQAQHQRPRRSAEVRRRFSTVDRLHLRGRQSTWSTSVSFCVAGAAREAPQPRSAEVRRRLSTVDEGCVCRKLGAPQSHLAWQAQHLAHLRLILRGRCMHHTEHLQRGPRKSDD